MTDSNYTAIKMVIDRSGSMQSIKEDAEGGVNGRRTKLRKAAGRRTVALAVFDTHYEEVCSSTDAADVAAFELRPRGGTALLDAIGRGITEFGEELAALSEDRRPGHVIFAIMTDGLENSSREWRPEQIRELIKRQTEQYKWNVVYLGANQDAVLVGESLGVAAGSSITYNTTRSGVRGMSSSLEGYVAVAAAGGPAEFSFADRDAAMKDDE